jgi:hypothetical protein
MKKRSRRDSETSTIRSPSVTAEPDTAAFALPLVGYAATVPVWSPTEAWTKGSTLRPRRVDDVEKKRRRYSTAALLLADLTRRRTAISDSSDQVAQAP